MTDCILFDGGLDGGGYGQVTRRKRGRGQFKAHRLAYEDTYGPIPDGLFVLHKCDVRNCVNPAHLWLGTQDDNMKDMVKKGRQGSRINSFRPRGELSGMSKLKDSDIPAMRKLRESGMTYVEIGRIYGVSETAAGKACRGKTYNV
jgi:hypothetical protein